MVSSSFDFYKNVVPFGNPLKISGTWNSVAKLPVKFEATAASIGFLSRVIMVISDDFAFTGGGSFRIQHNLANLGVNKYLYIDTLSIEGLLAHCTKIIPLTVPTATERIWTIIEIDPPSRVQKGPGEYVQISAEGSFTITTGSIEWVMDGWQMLLSEYDEIS